MKTETENKGLIILSQLGGLGRLSAMLGAHSFAADPAGVLQFAFKARAKKSINRIQVVLDPSDTYTLRMFKGRNCAQVYECEGLYADQLREIIERETGLYLSL